ncbi:MAG: Ig-like domain-containing protein, partial [Proteobacteria bacterium]|nr:Ig-like domain-containing protein [Pseudomonadota bacterium]
MEIRHVRWALFLLLGILVLSLAACGPGGSAEPDATGATAIIDDGGTSTVSGNLTGTVYGDIGTPIPGATVTVFSVPRIAVTGDNGQYGVTVTYTPHGMIFQGPSSTYADIFRFVDLTTNKSLKVPVIFNRAIVAPLDRAATSAFTVPSNVINGYSATLAVPAQASNNFEIADPAKGATATKTYARADFALEMADLSRPLPFPLPDSGNRSYAVTTGVGRQAPMAVVTVRPVLLRNLSTLATLTLPNPGYLSPTNAVKVLHFSPERHVWEDTGYTLDVASTAGFPIVEGGLYGVFTEKDRTAWVQGTIDAPAGSFVFLGDQVDKIDVSGEEVSFKNVHIPFDGSPVKVVVVDGAGGSKKETSVTLTYPQPGFAAIPPITGSVGSVTLSSLGDPQAYVGGGNGGTVNIRATVTDPAGNAAAEGTTVNFYVDGGFAQAVTTSGGTADFALTSGNTPTTVSIRATAGGVGSNEVSIRFVPGTIAKIVLAPVNSTMNADGQTPLTLKATAQDSYSNYVADGRTINFSAVGPDGNPAGVLTPASKTTVNGVAETVFTATTEPGWYTVVARGGQNNITSNQVYVRLNSSPVSTVTLTVGGTVVVANGQPDTTLTAEVLDAIGSPVPNNTPVTFTTTAGSFGGLTRTTVMTSNGTASVKLTSPIRLGTGTVKAEAGGIQDSVGLTFVAGPVTKVGVTIKPTSLLADGESTSALTVMVQDFFGNPVINENIHFEAASGAILPVNKITDADGRATATYTASTISGQHQITATATNSVSGAATITLVPVQAGSITATSAKSEVVADGKSSTVITAEVLDGAGNPLLDGTVVTFANSTVYGSLSPTTATTLGGRAAVVLTSPVKANQIAVVTASAQGLSGSVIVKFIPGPPHRIEAVANPQSIPATFLNCPGDEARILATVVDANGNPVADGTEVTFALDKGWIWDSYPKCDPPILVTTFKTETTGNGTAKVGIFGDDVVQTATVDICSGGLCYTDQAGTRGLKLYFGSSLGEGEGLPAFIDLEVNPSTLQIKGFGNQQSVITARVYDGNGNPISDTYEGGDGSTLAGSNVFTALGASFLRRGFDPGDALEITAGADNGLYTVTNVTESTLTLSRTLTATADNLTYRATIKGNITFEIILGPGGGENLDDLSADTPSIKSTQDGVATTALISGNLPGTVNVRVDCQMYNKHATAISPEIGIQSGPPAQISFGPSGTEISNGDGTNTRFFYAIVQDKFGNPVPNGTAVAFGLVDNGALGMGLGYKTTGINASGNAGEYTVTAPGAQFQTNGVAPGDTLIIIEPAHKLRGGYIIKTVDTEDQVTLYKKLSFSGTGLDFIAGSSEFGVVAGTGQTANYGTPGVVLTSVTYPRLNAGNRPVTLYAATSAFDLDLNPYNLGTTWTGVYSGSQGVGEVTLTAGKDEIVANGVDRTRLDVKVYDTSGNLAPDGTQVTFESTAGTLSALTASTLNGLATVYLTSTTSLGNASVTASAEGVSAKATISFVAGPVQGPIKMFVQPGNLVADGSSTSQITVIAADSQGNPVADENIRFSVPEGIVLPIVATTDSNGIAKAVYTAASVEGTYTITATAANGQTGTGQITLIGIPIGSVTVTAVSNELVADGLTNTLITATVLDGTGRPVDGVDVTFSNSTQYGQLSATTATTLGGSASVVLTAPTQAAKLAVIRAEAGGLVGSTIIHFIPGPPHRIVAVANPQTVPANFVDCPGDESRILATVLDINDNPVADGTEVSFSLNKGWIWEKYPDCQPPLTVVTQMTRATGNGTAKIAIFGDDVVQTATVDICTGGMCYEDASGSRGLKIKFGSSVGPATGLPAYLELKVSTNTLQVKGTGARQTATITAAVFDETGNPIEDSYASGDGQTTAGSDIFTSTSANWITRGYSAGDQLIINSGGDNGTQTIQAVLSETEIRLSANMVFTNTDLSFTAQVVDNIRFTILLGPGGGETLDGNLTTSLKSTSNGAATASLLTGILPGTVTILVEAFQGGRTATAVTPEIGIQAGPPAVINLAPTGLEFTNPDGTNTRTYFAMVMDRFGNPVPDGTAVYFGLVDNQNQGMGNGYKTAAADAVVFAGGYTVTSATAGFVANGLVPGDTLIITQPGSRAQGGYLIKSVDSPTQVTLYKATPANGAGLSFVAGSAELGLIGGVAQTGNEGNPGVVTTYVTYPRFAAGNKPVTIYASTSGFDLNLNPYNLGTTWSGTFGATQSVGEVLVTIGSSSVVADGLTSVRVDAAVSDVAGMPVPDGTPVTFTTTAGTLSLTETVTLNGVGSVYLKSPTGVGQATVTATVAGISGTDSILFIPGPPETIKLTASPANLTADGSSSSIIRAVVTDAQGNAVASTVEINFSLQSGSGRLLTLSTSVVGGIAQTTYVAGTIPGIDIIRARTTNGEEEFVNITLVGSSVGSVSVTRGSASIVADGASSSLITARVLDSNLSPVPDGTLVTFTTTAGFVDAYTAVGPGAATTFTAPTVNGDARVLLFSSVRVGQAGVTATVGGVSGSTIVQFIPGAVDGIVLSANPANLSADGSSLSTIRALVTDAQGNAVDNETISFTIVPPGGGRLISSTGATADGVAEVSYEAGEAAGTVTIRAASTNGVVQTTT